MKLIENGSFQGDVAFMRISNLPENVKKAEDADEYVVAHSETGHHHVARSKGKKGYLEFYEDTKNPLIGYLKFKGPVEIHHRRNFNTHEAQTLLDKMDNALDDNTNYFKVIRQRQETPEGLARVVD